MGIRTVRSMRGLPLSLAALCMQISGVTVAVEPAAATTAAPASAAPVEGGRTVYQQRGADGRVTLTDRPAAGLATERRWRVDPPEDAASAAERREAGRVEAERVTERIQRSIDRQQALDNELQIEQSRAQREADALAAARLRERDLEYEARPYAVLPGRPWFRPPAPRPPNPRPPGTDKPLRPAEPMLRVGPRTSNPAARETER